jgi:hypothetical protein
MCGLLFALMFEQQSFISNEILKEGIEKHGKGDILHRRSAYKNVPLY